MSMIVDMMFFNYLDERQLVEIKRLGLSFHNDVNSPFIHVKHPLLYLNQEVVVLRMHEL